MFDVLILRAARARFCCHTLLPSYACRHYAYGYAFDIILADDTSSLCRHYAIDFHLPMIASPPFMRSANTIENRPSTEIIF